MPTVPSYGDPRAPERPFPAVRVDPRAPIEAFGGGPGLEEANEAAKALADIGFRAQDDANAARMSEMRRALFDWEKANIHDPETGAKWKVGKDAIGIGSQLAQSFDARSTQLEQGLANQSQREAFRGMVDARRGYLQAWADDHEGEQIRVYRLSEREAGIESSKERAAVDPSTAPLELEIVRDNVHDIGKVRGWGPEELALELKRHENDFHLRALSGLLKGGNLSGAKAYFENYGAGMSPDAVNKVVAALQDGDRRAAAYDIIDRVFADTRVREYTGSGNNWTEKGEAAASSWEQARERIKRDAGGDAELRQLAEQMGRQRWGEISGAQKVSQDLTYERIAKLQDQPGNQERDPAELDPIAFGDLPVEKRDALRRRYKAPEKLSDDARRAWLDFSALTDEEIRKLPQSDYEEKYWTKLNQHYRDKADTIKRQALEAGEKKEKAEAWKSRMSDDELMLKGFVGAGLGGGKMTTGGTVRRADTLKAISEDPDASKHWIAFKEKIDERTEAHHTKTGKNPDDKELKKIIAEVGREESRQVTLDRTWPVGNQPKRVVDLTDDDVRDFEFIDLQQNEPALQTFYNVAKTLRLPSAPAGLSPREFYSRNAAAVNRAFLLQWKEPDLTNDELRLRWARILKGEE